MTAQLEVTLRLLEEGDLAQLSRDLGLSLHHIENRWRERRAGLRTMLVAELDGAAVGSVSFEPRAELSNLLHLYALGVAPARQRRGIGTRLIGGVEAEARAARLSGVHLGVNVQNDGAIRLYRRLGYERTGDPYDARWTWFGPDGEQREVVERCYRMVKRLGHRPSVA